MSRSSDKPWFTTVKTITSEAGKKMGGRQKGPPSEVLSETQTYIGRKRSERLRESKPGVFNLLSGKGACFRDGETDRAARPRLSDLRRTLPRLNGPSCDKPVEMGSPET